MKKLKKRLLELKKKLKPKLKQEIAARASRACATPPRYDDVFFEGLEQLSDSGDIHFPDGCYLVRIRKLD